MRVYLLEDTKIGVADNVFDGEKLKDLYDLTLWADENDLRLHDLGEDDMLSPYHDEADEPATEESKIDEWGKRNLSIDRYPKYYRRVSDELSGAICKLFEDYMELIGVGRDTEYREIYMDVLHSIKKSDFIDEHFDCFDYGIVFYVGATEDYTGGDLYFPDVDITLPMVPNRLLIIPSDINHKVNAVEGGTRVSMTTFVPIGPHWRRKAEGDSN